MLRGVNVGGKNLLPMAELRALCERMGLRDVRTYIQSGNVVYRGAAGADELKAAIAAELGIACEVAVRTEEELRAVAARNPFPGRDPKKLLVVFLMGEPVGAEKVMALGIEPEEIRIVGREMFIYFPLGQGVSKLPMGKIERLLGTSGTGRNWNTVEQLLAMATEGE